MCKSKKYKGLIIYYNEDGSKFQTPYVSIANPFIQYSDGRNPHCHVTSDSVARQVIDCYSRLRLNKRVNMFARNIRNKACRLLGYYIMSL